MALFLLVILNAACPEVSKDEESARLALQLRLHYTLVCDEWKSISSRYWAYSLAAGQPKTPLMLTPDRKLFLFTPGMRWTDRSLM